MACTHRETSVQLLLFLAASYPIYVSSVPGRTNGSSSPVLADSVPTLSTARASNTSKSDAFTFTTLFWPLASRGCYDTFTGLTRMSCQWLAFNRHKVMSTAVSINQWHLVSRSTHSGLFWTSPLLDEYFSFCFTSPTRPGRPWVSSVLIHFATQFCPLSGDVKLHNNVLRRDSC